MLYLHFFIVKFTYHYIYIPSPIHEIKVFAVLRPPPPLHPLDRLGLFSTGWRISFL